MQRSASCVLTPAASAAQHVERSRMARAAVTAPVKKSPALTTVQCSVSGRSNDRSEHDVCAAVHRCAKDSADVYSRNFRVCVIAANFSRLDDKYRSFVDERCIVFPQQ